MSRPVATRALHPVVASLWGVFLFWSLWLGAVWVLHIGPGWLGYNPWEQIDKLPNDELMQAIEMLAAKVELIWLVLAVACLHLFVASAHGLRTARSWLALIAGFSLAFGALNSVAGYPFGRMSFLEPLGLRMSDWRNSAPPVVSAEPTRAAQPASPEPAQGRDVRLFDVPVGWPFLWVVLVIAAREGVLRLRPRASHYEAVFWTGLAVALTLVNLEPIASGQRFWWRWHGPDALDVVPFRWWTPLGYLGCAWFAVFFLRERDVIAAASRRSLRPLILLGIINTLALASHFRNLLH